MSKDRIQKKGSNNEVTGKHIKRRNRGGGKGRKPMQWQRHTDGQACLCDDPHKVETSQKEE